jgi:hypothetical protein
MGRGGFGREGKERRGEGAFREKNGPCRRWHLF